MSHTLTTSHISAAGSARLSPYRAKRRSHRPPQVATLPPGLPDFSPAPGRNRCEHTQTSGPRREVLSFEAWMGGAGLLGHD